MVDTDKLRQAVNNFQFYARPTQANVTAPVTVQDVNNLVNRTATVLYQFINELEKNN
jgi:hypothetical protein